jgi:hypothetical protein
MTDDEKRIAAVYVGFGTFKNALERLSVGIPSRIDKSAFPGQSWGVIAQLLTGLRFLGLIDEQGNPSPRLSEVASTEEEERKRQLNKLMRERYKDVFALDLTRATPAQLTEVFSGAYSVTGDTREKAVRFFLSALQYLGIPVSPLLQSKGAANGGGGAKRKKGGRNKAKPTELLVAPVVQPILDAGTAKVFRLQTPGGELTISTHPGFLALNAADRKLIFDLMDKVEEHEKGAPQLPSGQSQTGMGGEE